MPKLSLEYVEKDYFKSTIENKILFIGVGKPSNVVNGNWSPPEIFITSLAACSMVYAQSYCLNHGLDPEGLKITIGYNKIQTPTRLGQMTMVIEAPRAPEEKKQALKKAATSCLLHHTLENFDGIKTEII